MERRKENIEWLQSIIEQSSGKWKEHELVTMFCQISGLRAITVKEYIDLLKKNGVIYVYWGRIYHKEVQAPKMP